MSKHCSIFKASQCEIFVVFMDAQTCEKLRLLALYLKHLPDSIPTVRVSATEYGFDFFTCEDDDIADMGAV
jgi:hypothetical protein